MLSIVNISSLLLPIICGVHQELKLIRDLNDFFNFDHNILLLDSSIDTTCFVDGESTPKSLYVFESANDNVTGLESLTEITSKNTFMVVVTGSSKLDNNLMNLVEEIQKLQIDMKIGVFFANFASQKD